MNSTRTRFVYLAIIVSLSSLGCARLMNLQSEDGRDQGYTLVLTGIEGANVIHTGFVSGLRSGGVASKIEVVDWTTGIPALLLVHLRDDSRHRDQAERIASKIVSYQDQFPGRPVNVIGHSGGGGMTLLTLEALPADRRINSAILLAAAISPDYDLRRVLPKVDQGLWNFSSKIGDSLLLIAGTSAFGTIDGLHSPSAGAVGFRIPMSATEADRRLYFEKCVERPYQLRMALDGNLSDHYGPLNPLFARNEVAPLLGSTQCADAASN